MEVGGGGGRGVGGLRAKVHNGWGLRAVLIAHSEVAPTLHMYLKFFIHC